MSSDHRTPGSGRSRWVAGHGRTVLTAAAVAMIVLASVSLAFVLGGGLRDTAGPVSSSVTAAPTDAAPSDRSPSPLASAAAGGTTAPGIATPRPGNGATAAPGTSASPGTEASPDTPKTEIKAKRIRLERLGIDQKIIEGDGIDAPIGKAAHFPGSGWPYGGTNIYIYGHAREGMFIRLWDARKGDEIVLDLADGSSRTYLVTRVLPKVPWDAVQYLDPTPTEQLTVQTSTSYYPTAPRFIVIAVPAP